MRRCVSGPWGTPIRGRDPATSRNVSASIDTPSSAGRGEGQARTSSSHVEAMACAPIAGTTATGLPVAGTTTNQGRVGLCQNWVRRPVK